MRQKIIGLIALLVPIAGFSQCEKASTIHSLESRFERSLNRGDLDFFEEALHQKFVWVHDNASMVQSSKSEFLTWFAPIAKTITDESAGTRTQRDVTILVDGNTAIVYGFTDVERAGQSPTFHFMRTYVSDDRACLLISNHTMEIQ